MSGISSYRHRWLLELSAGSFVFMVLWLSPLVSLSRQAFWLHMVFHLALVLLVSPLLALPLSRFLTAATNLSATLAWAFDGTDR